MNTWKRACAMGLAVIAATFFACDKIDTKGSRELKTMKDKVSYGIGLDIGRSFKQQNLAMADVDLDKLRMGITDALSGTKPALSDSQLTETMMAFQKEMMARADSTNKRKAEENKKKGEENAKLAAEFMEKNAKEPGVVTTPSGLQYKIITEGKGPKPDSSSTVTVHYVGTLLDGTVFDSSIKRGQPVSFPVGNVIKGWTEALQLMPVGSKWKLFIPPALGYGERGAGEQIGPNSVLIFEVELISLGDANAPAPGGKPSADPHANQGH
jgi:FKBP-type peptidyl-prolyl cis-trans isomerase FklB